MAKPKKIKQPVDQRASELLLMEAQWKRALADYQNLEKRTHNERLNYIRLANTALLAQLIPVADDLERAMNHLNDQGLRLVYNQFMTVLKNEGLTEIEALNQTYNPETMECIDRVEGKKDLVYRVDQKGYMMGEAVVRPAKVAVGNGLTDKVIQNINDGGQL